MRVVPGFVADPELTPAWRDFGRFEKRESRRKIVKEHSLIREVPMMTRGQSGGIRLAMCDKMLLQSIATSVGWLNTRSLVTESTVKWHSPKSVTGKIV